jgi:hypothetical protein
VACGQRRLAPDVFPVNIPARLVRQYAMANQNNEQPIRRDSQRRQFESDASTHQISEFTAQSFHAMSLELCFFLSASRK